MGNWLWRNAGGIPAPDNDWWTELVCPHLIIPARAFIANARQIRHFWELPPYVLKVFQEHLEAFEDTAERLTGKKRFSAEEHAQFEAEILAGTKELLEEKASDPRAHLRAVRKYDLAIDTFGRIIDDIPELDRAVRATLSAQLSLSWTAFETLCGDVARAIDATTGVLPSDQTFQSLFKIQKAYALLFPTDAKITDIVTDTRLRQLNIVRNLFAHKAGVVDQKSIDDAAKIGWTLPGEVEKDFVIDGEVVRSLAAPAIELGIELIEAVDKSWVAAHPLP